jgi:hypothetical protein
VITVSFRRLHHVNGVVIHNEGKAMTEISLISSALQSQQNMLQNELAMVATKQVAQAEKALADILAKNVQAAQNLAAGEGGMDIYV